MLFWRSSGVITTYRYKNKKIIITKPISLHKTIVHLYWHNKIFNIYKDVPVFDWPSCRGSMVWIINWSKPCLNFAWLPRLYVHSFSWTVARAVKLLHLRTILLLLHSLSSAAGILMCCCPSRIFPTLLSLLVVHGCWKNKINQNFIKMVQ